jgi:hypothetical protein
VTKKIKVQRNTGKLNRLCHQGGYEFVEQQKHKTERFLREVLQQKLDLSVEELTDAVVDKLLDEQGGALDLTDEQQENLAKAKGSKRRSLLEQVGSKAYIERSMRTLHMQISWFFGESQRSGKGTLNLTGKGQHILVRERGIRKAVE